MNTDRIHYLFRQYMHKTCTREELQELLACIAQPEYQQALEQLMDKEYDVLQPLAAAQEVDWEYVYRQVTQPTGEDVLPLYKKGRFRWIKMSIAATVMLALGAGSYWWFSKPSNKEMAQTMQPAQHIEHDVLPGGDKAILTLANGRAIVLDSAHNGVLAREGNVEVVKKNDELKYDAGSKKFEVAMTYNTLATPRGGNIV